MPVLKLNDIFAGRYILSELMEDGEFSEVWKARDQMAEDSLVALKIYSPKKDGNEDGVHQLKQEFYHSQHLSHSHLSKISHFDVSQGVPYLVMPLSSKGSLARLSKQRGSFNERQVAIVMCQIASSLEVLHKQEPPLLHLRVKPENILVERDDYFLLSGFGINTKGHSSLVKPGTNTNQSLLSYSPPESFDQFQETDTSADIFSLGVTLFELCSKNLPWGGTGGLALLRGEKVPNLPSQYSTELNELIQSCMAVNKRKRPDARELHLRGKNFLETGSWNLPENKSGVEILSKRMIPYLLAAAVVAVLALSAFWGIQNNYLKTSLEIPEKMGSSQVTDQRQDLDEMLIATLEQQLEEMTRRVIELEKENQQLRRQSPISSNLVEERELSVEETPVQPPKKDRSRVFNFSKSNNVAASSTVPLEKGRKRPLPEEFEIQLNKISNPGMSGKAREAWKKETLAQFSEGAVRILDETEGKPKRYSASIFLNLLYNVPHTIEVKEVKRDQNRKITELRLEMQPKG